MKEDFFSFQGSASVRADDMEELGTFSSLHSDLDVDLISNWTSAYVADEAHAADVPGELMPLESESASGLFFNDVPESPSQQGVTAKASLQSEMSVFGDFFGKSLWIDTPRDSTSPKLQLPEMDDEIFGFRLLFELGAGAFAKVFLAMQGELADREVVLKISAIEGTEPQTLAQLQHTHVVPIYSVHEDRTSGLRAVCMPYFGGASLSRVLEELWRSSGPPQTGQQLLESLDRVSGPEPATKVAQRVEAARSPKDHLSAMQSVHTARSILAGLNYVQAASWLVARLAEGLHHSHERNVIHRDIKPSNILLSAESQPLLLDFNVSQAVDCAPHEASMGGTMAYMAPEHLRAMLNYDSCNTQVVNHRSDVYSLGLVLYEMLQGKNPFQEPAIDWFSPQQRDAVLQQREREVASLRKSSPLEIPWSLESIVRKCLAPCPLDRYLTAAQLAEDLTRFLQDLPLRYAPELSRIEQLRKWGRRHPRLTTTGIATLIAAALIIPGAILLTQTRSDLATKQQLLVSADAAERARRFQTGTLKALYQINTVTPDMTTLAAGLQTSTDTLNLFHILSNPNWQTGLHWRSLEPQDRAAVAEKVRELLIVRAAAIVRTAPEPVAKVEEALGLLQIADGIRELKPSQALLLDRARYWEMAGKTAAAIHLRQQAETVPAVTAHDIYMLGSAHARSGTVAGYQSAIELLGRALTLDPRHYWAHFERALCYQELGQKLQAVADLSACTGLWPESPWAHFNLGCLLDQERCEETAISHYTAAIQHDPRFLSAYFNRGLAYLEKQEFERARADFEHCRTSGRNDQVLAAALAMSLEGLGRHAEADELFELALVQTRQEAPDQVHQISWTYAFAISGRAPQIAQQVFENILAIVPNHPQASYGRGMLSMQQGQVEDAIRWFDQSVNSDSRLIEPVRYRAICLARSGRFQEAATDANVCLERDGRNPESLYIASCVAALSARKFNSAELRQHALKLLYDTIELSPVNERAAWRQRAANDADLTALRDEPDFQELAGISLPEPASSRDDSL